MAMKISEVFDRADKELTQIIGMFGSRSEKRACANGALTYYLGDKEVDSLTPLDSDVGREMTEKINKFQHFLLTQYHGSIATLNDGGHRWKFKDFKNAALEFQKEVKK